MLVLTAGAWLRGAEYDEQYTLFLIAGTARPDWPIGVFPAGTVTAVQAGHATLAGIARDLRATDVHPPLYFWLAWAWRTVFGPSLFALRMLSVGCGVVSVGLTGVIARRCGIHPVAAMLLTLGCTGFVYTNLVARGFAPAMALTLGGVVLLLDRRTTLAGVCMGAACCCNYLAVFVAVAAVVASGAWAAGVAMVPFLAVDAWFFVAQHASRSGQFPPFSLGPGVARLAEYQVAAVFGGLPLYVDGVWRVVAATAAAVFGSGLTWHLVRGRPWGGRTRVLLAAALAPPVGLLLLGAVFDTTPIELRYLCFGLPFVALLVAGTMPSRWGWGWIGLVLAVQCAGVAGLLLSPRTMQPARNVANQAAAVDAVALVPRGNDGVGIVGAFGIEAPAGLKMLVLGPSDPIVERVGEHHRVALALMAQDRDSTAMIAAARIALAGQGWRRVAIGSTLEVYERGE